MKTTDVEFWREWVNRTHTTLKTLLADVETRKLGADDSLFDCVDTLRDVEYRLSKLVVHRPCKIKTALVEDPTDDTNATLYVEPCACVGNPKCPRSRGLARAADLYDTVSVVERMLPTKPRRAKPKRNTRR